MNLTLLGFVRSIPEFQGRAYFGVYGGVGVPGTPYAIVEDVPGGPTPLYGGLDLMTVYPQVTVFSKPDALNSSGQTVLRMIGDQLVANAHRQVNLHSDGVTPFLRGVQRATDFVIFPDTRVQGQWLGTLRLRAQFYRV